jgi:O-antigen ligase
LTALQGTEDANFQWRTQERWPYFMEKIRENPWFGIGTNRDLELSDEANTPHNGYISLACIFGIPATVLVVAFGLLGALNGYRLSREQRPADERVFGVAAVGCVAGVLVHNIVESMFLVTFVYNCYWALAALTTVAATRQPVPLTYRAAVPRVARTRRALQRRPLRPVLGRGSAEQGSA